MPPMRIVAKLEILLTDEGQVIVNGPITDRMMCYGLLGVAKDSIRTHNAQEQQKIVQPTGLERVALVGQ